MSESIQLLEKLVSSGRYLEARQLTTKLKGSQDVNQVRVDQLLALSLSKSGSPESALEHLEPVYKQHADDPETAGIMGGIYKDLFKKHQDSKYAILSRDTYLKNFQTTKNYYPGINAATMSAIAGRAAQGREIASQVIALLNPESTDFWELATLGEAHLLTKNRTQSVEFFIKARQLAGTDWGKVTSVYNQLWLLNHYAPVPKEIQKVFSPPAVVAFVGHMIDHPERTVPRFPASIESNVKEAIKGAIKTLNASIGYCSLACGGDILFAEAMEEAGGEVQLFLPFAKDDFVNISVRFAGDHWVERFERLMNKFPVTYVTEEQYGGFDDLFSFQSRIIFGTAVLRSASYHQEPTLLTVLSDTDLRRKEGGTRDTVRVWPFADKYINVNPDQFVAPETVAAPVSSDFPTIEKKIARPVLYLVLADLSQLPVLERERVNKVVQTKLADELIPYKAFEQKPDSIFISFDAETSAIDFVQLIMVQQPKVDHPIKLSLHAGPVYLEDDGQRNAKMVEGENITLIQEMNRLSPRGGIVASDHFASLLALNAKKFKLEYAGMLQGSSASKARGIYNVTIKI
ncbi:MAG: DUF4071 domain-containing protein [Cyclobacteriaceae bacterium]|nr:DUF4071 domain-containing protein [Cyclobacteriaceae bacterium]UYN88385.1 MAG: DUF4071 domain-containing protein [Cyclobacteriaceae bacterium]